MGLSDDYMTTRDAAHSLGIHPLAVSHMCAAGRLPAEKIANRWFIPRAFVEEFAKTYVPKVGRPRQKRQYTKRSEIWFKQR